VVIFLLVTILAVLLLGAPVIIEGVLSLGAIALAAIGAGAAVILFAEAISDPLGTLELAAGLGVFGAWVWAFVKFKAIRWTAAVVFPLLVALTQIVPLLGYFGLIK
jgi:hypothetical protein